LRNTRKKGEGEKERGNIFLPSLLSPTMKRKEKRALEAMAGARICDMCHMRNKERTKGKKETIFNLSVSEREWALPFTFFHQGDVEERGRDDRV